MFLIHFVCTSCINCCLIEYIPELPLFKSLYFCDCILLKICVYLFFFNSFSHLEKNNNQFTWKFWHFPLRMLENVKYQKRQKRFQRPEYTFLVCMFPNIPLSETFLLFFKNINVKMR